MAAKKKATTKQTKKEDHSVLFGILTYIIFLVGLIWYLVDEKVQKNKFMKFHFKQSLVLMIAYVILIIIASILPFINLLLVPLLQIAMLVYVIIGIINVVDKKQKELPFIGKFAEKFKF